MRTVIIGHRGSGKTSFLGRVSRYYRQAGRAHLCLDLDAEIESRQKRPIEQLFLEEGEAGFRSLELETFREVVAKAKSFRSEVFLSLGAGFPPEQIPHDWKALWLRRGTDQNGRIFLDRPTLDASLPPLEEYLARRAAREPKFAARADSILELQEGLDHADPVEQAFVLGTASLRGGAISVLPARAARPGALLEWIAAGIHWLELRDDLLSESTIEALLALVPKDRVLFSFRDPTRRSASRRVVERHALHFDWPLEWGACGFASPRYLSLHERKQGESLEQTLGQFPETLPTGAQAKAAVPIRNLEELEIAHRWQKQSPGKRIFLPGSQDGRWAWYRLLRGEDYSLNFFREGPGTSPDQPPVMEWLRARMFPPTSGRFAAVLGDPIQHSRTPLEHFPFFRELGAATFALRLPADELSGETLGFLRSLGLRWAAVTAPLKIKVARLCQANDVFPAVNTLSWSERAQEWLSTNTDREGLRALSAAPEIPEPLAVWGGGGTLPLLREAFPAADFYSARTGSHRDSAKASCGVAPRTVIWACGRRQPEFRLPPASWKPQLVLDLSYSEDSGGRAYAKARGAKYLSGIAWFSAQAAAQREFWRASK